eukprot:347770_1
MGTMSCKKDNNVDHIDMHLNRQCSGDDISGETSPIKSAEKIMEGFETKQYALTNILLRAEPISNESLIVLKHKHKVDLDLCSKIIQKKRIQISILLLSFLAHR